MKTLTREEMLLFCEDVGRKFREKCDKQFLKIFKGEHMERQKVKSSNVNSVGYDPETKILEVEFEGGGVYEYYDVPHACYTDMMAAPSVGGFLSKYVRKQFKYKALK